MEIWQSCFISDSNKLRNQTIELDSLGFNLIWNWKIRIVGWRKFTEIQYNIYLLHSPSLKDRCYTLLQIIQLTSGFALLGVTVTSKYGNFQGYIAKIQNLNNILPTSVTISSGTSFPLSMYSFAFFPISVPEETSARSRSPVDICTRPYCRVR